MIRLLIIDDHEMVREGLKAMLVAEPDFEIVGDAANAEQAFELLERLHPDVILLDIRLPGVSGIDVCRAVTERRSEERRVGKECRSRRVLYHGKENSRHDMG